MVLWQTICEEGAEPLGGRRRVKKALNCQKGSWQPEWHRKSGRAPVILNIKRQGGAIGLEATKRPRGRRVAKKELRSQIA